jgi:hypothetical protein
MNVRIVALEAWHFESIVLQDAQRNLQPLLHTEGYRSDLLRRSVAFSAVDDAVIAIAGVALAWPEREVAWSLLSNCGPRRFATIHRAAKRFLESRRTRRIEMTVDAAHDSAGRWARLLGFQEEGLMHAYTPDGRDAILYARVRDERP